MFERRPLLALLVVAVLAAGSAAAKTPDGETPSEEPVCDEMSGAAFGLCNAYCEAMDCHLANDGDDTTEPNASPRACLRVLENYIKLTAEVMLPCEVCPQPGTGTGSGDIGCVCIANDDCASNNCESGSGTCQPGGPQP